ncbi:hypothetical protein MTR_4g043715 [Medicago truncatula]|uniref:Uncharacterized protein n=1 Tax=Medicago truncatula TaxID=3880 RepID=A0A072UIM3_MEDTR|nr:hypothetical protein MTR_4g043715 [Medicago truncatula]
MAYLVYLLLQKPNHRLVLQKEHIRDLDFLLLKQDAVTDQDCAMCGSDCQDPVQRKTVCFTTARNPNPSINIDLGQPSMMRSVCTME